MNSIVNRILGSKPATKERKPRRTQITIAVIKDGEVINSVTCNKEELKEATSRELQKPGVTHLNIIHLNGKVSVIEK